MKKITIGSAVYDDPQGVWYTYQSIRLNNQDIINNIELIVIDNNPSSQQGRATKEICKKMNARYIPYDRVQTTACRNLIFSNSTSEYTMSIDSHVLLEPDAIKRLLKYLEDNPTEDLLQGPMLHDQFEGYGLMETHMEPVWRSDMFGTWAKDDRGFHKDNEPFEIPMHGLGLFVSKTDSWLKFHPLFKGFGGEEGYIHTKYKKHGRKTLCLPFLRWLHRFRINEKVPYKLSIDDRIRNYALGHLENELDVEVVRDYFNKNRPNVEVDEIVDDAIQIHDAFKESPDLIESMLNDEYEIPKEEPRKETEKRGWGGGNLLIPEPKKYLRIKALGKFPIRFTQIFTIVNNERFFLQLKDGNFDNGITLTEKKNYVDFITEDFKESFFMNILAADTGTTKNIAHLSLLTSSDGQNWTEMYGIDT